MAMASIPKIVLPLIVVLCVSGSFADSLPMHPNPKDKDWEKAIVLERQLENIEDGVFGVHMKDITKTKTLLRLRNPMNVADIHHALEIFLEPGEFRNVDQLTRELRALDFLKAKMWALSAKQSGGRYTFVTEILKPDVLGKLYADRYVDIPHPIFWIEPSDMVYLSQTRNLGYRTVEETDLYSILSAVQKPYIGRLTSERIKKIVSADLNKIYEL